MQDKLRSVEDDASDIRGEFELERQDYLETIRRQEQTILLQQQVLETMVPLVRRECNYHNLDKVFSECKFDEEQGRWILPKVSNSTTSLSPVTSKSALTSSSSSSSSHSPMHTKQLKRATISDGRVPVDDLLSQRLQRADEHDYFKQKRAQELLAECSMRKEIASTPPGHHRQLKGTTSLSTVHSIPMSHEGIGNHSMDSRFLPVNDSLARPRKLESLNHPPLPGAVPSNTLTPLPENQSLVDKVDKMIAQRRRWDALPDSTRKPYL